MVRERLDSILVKKKLIESRERAKRLILAGKVYVNGAALSKAGSLINEDSRIEVKEGGHNYVSRGGVKLEGAIKEFNINISGLTALDAGASTGGFTDCLLQKKVKKVYAVDVGYGQLAWKIRTDKRVVVIEKKNVRYLKIDDLGEKVDMAVIDLSFISVKLVLNAIISVLKNGGQIIALIKPQFEVGKGEVGKGGIVKDDKSREKVLDNIKKFAEEAGLSAAGLISSPITGAKGNKEYFYHFLLNKGVLIGE